MLDLRVVLIALALALCLGCPTTDDDDASDDDTGDDDITYPDEDGDGYTSDVDCNDYNADVYPGAPQICDAVIDNDCDGFIDETETDADGDGYDECDGDCDDTNAEIHPNVVDPVDGVDNDCDGTTDEDVIDCLKVPTAPISETLLQGARGYHGLAIDEFGFIVGSDGNALIKSDYAGKWSVFTPGMGSCEQMTYLPDGDLAVVNTNLSVIQRVSPAGVPTVLTSSNWIYGLIYGPDGMLYTAGSTQITRIDPDTGASEVVLTINGTECHTVAFSGDATRMYIGTVGGGNLYVVELDGNLDPLGPPTVHATFGGWHDGLGEDVCGHVFVVDYNTTSLWRVAPDGTPTQWVNWNTTQYGHGMIWGNGVGGWREDALYVPLPYNNNAVKEVVVGIPHAHWGGTVYNGP